MSVVLVPIAPCEHPADSIEWNSARVTVTCRMCRQEVTLRGLAKGVRVAVAQGCRCPGNDCSGTCGYGTPTGWTLDPAKILAYVVAEEEGARSSRSLMLTLPADQWGPLEDAARERGSSLEDFCRSAVLRRIRDFFRYRD